LWLSHYALQDSEMSLAADIFAVGMIGATLLTGHSAQSVRRALAQLEFLLLVIDRDVSAVLAKALRLCLLDRAEERPSAAQLAAFLGRGAEWWREYVDAVEISESTPLAKLEEVCRPLTVCFCCNPTPVLQLYRQAMHCATGGDPAEAVSLLKSAAAQGHVRAVACLAFCRLRPYGGEPRDHRKATSALMWLWRRYTDPLAMLMLLLFRRDCRLAGADATPGCCTLGRARDALASECESWEVFARFVLAQCWKHGIGCEEDPKRAFRVLQSLGRHGFVPSFVKLGRCYYSGKGTATDQAEAVKWFQRGSDMGLRGGQFYLGLCYDMGRGIAVDGDKARVLYELARDQGHIMARVMLEDRDPDSNRDVPLYRVGADMGYPSAQCDLAFHLDTGRGISLHARKAMLWYRFAAELGYAHAQFEFGACWYHGKGVAVDRAEAVKWFRLAAHKGHTQAQFELGTCYLYGKGVGKDRALAIQYFERAAHHGDEAAVEKLKRLQGKTKVSQ
jgi:TPR repeat protein